MPKHKHKLEVLLEDQQIDIQDENLLIYMLLSDSQLCITMSNDKATMNSLSRREITILCLHNTITLSTIIQI